LAVMVFSFNKMDTQLSSLEILNFLQPILNL